jgi:hypothetical protein
MTAGDQYNKISCNSIYGNGDLGIDLYPFGINLNDFNDTDSGPNAGMNFPVITFADYWTFNSQTFLQGIIDSPDPQNCTIEIFLADSDSSSYGEGKTYVGYANPDAGGNWSVHVTGVNPGDIITATAIDASGNTSEFSHNAFVGTYTGILSSDMGDNITVYPNPFSDYTVIRFNYTSVPPLSIFLYNSTGQMIREYENTDKEEILLERNSLPDGLYFLNVEKCGEIIKTHKIIIE